MSVRSPFHTIMEKIVLEYLLTLLKKWKDEYPFSPDHKITVAKMILWVSNQIEGYDIEDQIFIVEV